MVARITSGSVKKRARRCAMRLPSFYVRAGNEQPARFADDEQRAGKENDVGWRGFLLHQQNRLGDAVGHVRAADRLGRKRAGIVRRRRSDAIGEGEEYRGALGGAFVTHRSEDDPDAAARIEASDVSGKRSHAAGVVRPIQDDLRFAADALEPARPARFGDALHRTPKPVQRDGGGDRILQLVLTGKRAAELLPVNLKPRAVAIEFDPAGRRRVEQRGADFSSTALDYRIRTRVLPRDDGGHT